MIVASGMVGIQYNQLYVDMLWHLICYYKCFVVNICHTEMNTPGDGMHILIIFTTVFCIH